jgi:tetratricopeptide (TPR) repeat protein
LFQWATGPWIFNDIDNSSLSSTLAQGGDREALSRSLRARAADSIDRGILLGFDAPSILHSRGSLAMDDGDNELAARLFSDVLRKSRTERERSISAAVPITDGVNEVYTLNQLGNALVNLQKYDDAARVFEEGLVIDPSNLALITNAGSLYRLMQRPDLAMRVMKGAFQFCELDADLNFDTSSTAINLTGTGVVANSDTDGTFQRQKCPAPLLNNIGLIELDAGNYEAAARMFEGALRDVTALASMRAASADGSTAISGAVETMMANLHEAQSAIKRGK